MKQIWYTSWGFVYKYCLVLFTGINFFLVQYLNEGSLLGTDTVESDTVLRIFIFSVVYSIVMYIVCYKLILKGLNSLKLKSYEDYCVSLNKIDSINPGVVLFLGNTQQPFVLTGVLNKRQLKIYQRETVLLRKRIFLFDSIYYFIILLFAVFTMKNSDLFAFNTDFTMRSIVLVEKSIRFFIYFIPIGIIELSYWVSFTLKNNKAFVRFYLTKEDQLLTEEVIKLNRRLNKKVKNRNEATEIDCEEEIDTLDIVN